MKTYSAGKDRRVVMITLTRRGKLASRKIHGDVHRHPMEDRDGFFGPRKDSP